VVAIAEEGSVTRAAAALHQSSSSVSHTLLGLERELGIPLFHRLPRGMALTDAGTAFLPAARRALREVEVARATVDSVRGLLTGHLTVVGLRAFSVTLADIIAEFAETYPAVLTSVLPPRSESEIIELVHGGACEVGFIHAEGIACDLITTPVAREQIVAVVPRGHRLEGRTSVSMEELVKERIVGPLPTSPLRTAFDDMFREASVEPNVVAEGATNEMMLELARAGVGCTIASRSSAAMVENRGAAVVEIVPSNSTTVVLAMRKDQQPTPAAQALRALAERRYRLGSEAAVKSDPD
jgi:DNA-binding transcriptional LysR family regulator